MLSFREGSLQKKRNIISNPHENYYGGEQNGIGSFLIIDEENDKGTMEN